MAYCAGRAAIIVAYAQPLPIALVPPPMPPPKPVTIRLAWNPVTNAFVYNLYWGVASRVYTNRVTVTSTNAAVTNLVAGTLYYFAVTAVNAVGLESVYSEETANWPRTNLVLTLQPGTAPTAAGPWVAIGSPIVMTNPPAAGDFFRIIQPQLQRAASPAGPWTNIGAPLAWYGLSIRREQQP